jgi:hypothetical protein
MFRREGKIPCMARDFPTFQCPPRLWGLPNLIHWDGMGDLCPWVKRQRREAGRLPPSSSAEVKNDGAIPPVRHTPS